ncbi:MAG: class II fructose-bisphosphate aldolase [Lachnospiraceae bacterium]|nr:class II fructose-bisphosphate aldolase [Lachnospiraceae bacterium]
MDKYISSTSQQYFAFNIWSIESAKAVIDAASQMKCNIILQTSMKAFEQIDKKEFYAFVRSYEQKKGIKAYLHLDHCKEMDFIQEAAECGWDSVMIDASDKTLSENINITNKVVKLVQKKGILVEAEVGQICGQEDEVTSVGTGIAKMDDIEKFIKSTDIDMLAAAVGTVHGLYRGVPDIRYDMLDEIGRITDIPLVIHGGTGLTNEILLKMLIYKNVKKINISTDVKLAYKRGIEESIQMGVMEQNGFDPLKVEWFIHDEIQNMVMNKLKLLRKDSLR